MSKRLSALLTLSLFASTSFAQSSVKNLDSLQVALLGTGKQLQSEQPVRLEDVLKLAQAQQMVLQYPLGTTLFDESEHAKQETTALKNTVLNQMIQYNLAAHPLYTFIQHQPFAPRVLSAVDIDQVRLDKFDNPLLRGKLSLAAATRDEQVRYLGNLDNVFAVSSQAGIPMQQQLDNLASRIGELSQPPVLIYPDGNVVQPHHGAWLNTQYYLPPLTMVYIPFESLEESEMDQNIIKLLTQLKPMPSKTPL
ncbi:capsule biosynthesis GfcC family protein [Vibrio sp. PNB22_4_1]